MAKKSYDLVIVESPAKAKTIGRFLGDGFVVESSKGHIRDLPKNNEAIDIANGFEPKYIVSDADHEAVVSHLKKLRAGAANVWLASDEDREGEAISWHLCQVLDLDTKTTKRIVFHEITQTAISHALTVPRLLDMNLVDAQQARRILDRIVGFELSPVLWRKVAPKLSAGRVQSVAVRLLVEREREIIAFQPHTSYAVRGSFRVTLQGKTYTLTADLNHRFETEQQAEAFLTSCAKHGFQIDAVDSKRLTRQPAAPFTTSTLQQEANRRHSMSVAETMACAQRLYEAGLITYMRTDSVNLSALALGQARQWVTDTYGADYHHERQYKTHSKGAQEAHEAIRPTDLAVRDVEMSATDQRIYKLIRDRALASQMSDAIIERTTLTIVAPAADGAKTAPAFTASADVVIFDGFTRLYNDTPDEEGDGEGAQEGAAATLPAVGKGQSLQLAALTAREKWTQRPARYNEASLVKKLEEMGIGRPSTYAPTISTIVARKYVEKGSREGQPRQYRSLSLVQGQVQASTASENTGVEKNKLFPTDQGMIVTDFLVANFPDVVNYDFTAHVEESFDEIARGQKPWRGVLADFYGPFHKRVEDVTETAERSKGERLLGLDPASGKNVYVRLGRFGPMAQIGETPAPDAPDEEKPKYSSLRPDQHLETITLQEALKLFDLPRLLGQFEGKDLSIGVGRFGPYIKHDGKYTSLKKEDDPYTIGLARAVELVEAKREADANKLIRDFAQDEKLKVVNGRWGPYIAWGRASVKIPKGEKPEALTYERCLELCREQGADPRYRKKGVAAKEQGTKDQESGTGTTEAGPASQAKTAKTKRGK